MKTLYGTGTALITPFKNQIIDFPALEKIINFQIKENIDFIVSMGTTGEAPTLSTEEKHDLLGFTKEIINDRIPLVVGFGGNDTKALCEQVNQFNLQGVEAILSSSPAYNKPSQEGLFHHYSALANSTSKPIIIYNVPGRTSSNILAKTVIRLAESNNQFIGIKEATGDMNQATEILKNKPENFMFWSGDDPTALASISIGGKGCISVMSNIYPKLSQQMINLAINGQFSKALKIHHLLFDLHQWLYIDGNPVGIKQAMAFHDHCSSEVRLPLYSMSKDNKTKLQQCIEEIDGMIK